MERFEYDITKYPAEEFSQLVYFCSETGECSVEEVPDRQIDRVREILNKRGSEGWELVQMAFGRDGIVAVWKRSVEG